MKRIFLALALTVASAALASATTVLCNSGITDVTTLTGSNFCDLTGATNVLFGNFSVSYTGGALPPVGISTLAGQTNVSGGNINLGFQFEAPTNGTGDIQLEYTVTGGIDGIDYNLVASPTTNGGSITVSEYACTIALSPTCPIQDQLAHLSGTTSGTTPLVQSASFATTQTVYIFKDITFSNANSSEIQNSQMSPVPEPMTLSLMGFGLIGLGFAGRKLRKNQK
jgi:hypothetical protein